ncbi:uncharacterized protein SPPG_01841 [Spizellomyces punctatus DAOM BR117]|uniref:Uncharacterized protein n=1 Tax=Spizellomyces punctatus (strain DAOM BR117) TaxID=645134 RepID=A0A0L0HNX6_SPIPD|nr:uncharacterized protein SPPG_01841 [Spizellomyces punctatus DAOM BR117]KND02758.1 hypothetical protein SPPG_01841 [Spizellomyces punctatus DAOM BR117]|eukprot:XP_016610797.1 hypothetical protein SPPG_01841 [Spizellomyces punctatus DAOM BR117]
MVGSDEGTIRLYSGYDTPTPTLVSSFRAVSPFSALVSDWEQSSGVLVCGGEKETIRVWDAGKESCVQSIYTKSQAMVTSLTLEKGGHLLVAGYDNGNLGVHDMRMPSRDSLVKTYTDHPTAILKTGYQSTEFCSVSTGQIRLWDIRHGTNRVVEGEHDTGVVDIHGVVGLVGWGTKTKLDIREAATGRSIAMTRHHDGFLSSGRAWGGVTALAFHPRRVVVGACVGGVGVSVFSAEKGA